jgi:hypothetical protein
VEPFGLKLFTESKSVFLCKSNTFKNILYKEVKYAGIFTKNIILLVLIYTENKPDTRYVQVWVGKLKKKRNSVLPKCIYPLHCKGNVFAEAMKVAHSRNTFVILVASMNPELFSWNCGVDVTIVMSSTQNGFHYPS